MLWMDFSSLFFTLSVVPFFCFFPNFSQFVFWVKNGAVSVMFGAECENEFDQALVELLFLTVYVQVVRNRFGKLELRIGRIGEFSSLAWYG